MKFLMHAELLMGVPPPEDLGTTIQAPRVYLNTALAEGRLDCVHMYASGRQSVLIANAESHEELCGWLQANPSYPYWDFEVHPLADLNSCLDMLTN